MTYENTDPTEITRRLLMEEIARLDNGDALRSSSIPELRRRIEEHEQGARRLLAELSHAERCRERLVADLDRLGGPIPDPEPEPSGLNVGATTGFPLLQSQ